MDRRKALYISLASLGAVLLIALLAALVSVLGGKRYTSEKGTPYPYTWTEKRDGSVNLTLDARNAPGGVWTEETPEGDVAYITQSKTRGGVTAYRIRPMTAGVAELTFTLRQEGERLAEAVFSVEARRRRGEQKHDSLITSHVERVYQQFTVGGEDTGFPYAAESDQEGNLCIHIKDPLTANGIPGAVFGSGAPEALTLDNWASPGNWVASVTRTEEQNNMDLSLRWTASASDRSILYLDGPTAGAEGVDFYVRCAKDGTAEAVISSQDEDLSYVFTVRSAGGVASIVKAASGRYKAPAKAADVEAEADAAIDALLSGLPGDALPVDIAVVQEENEPVKLTEEQLKELEEAEKREWEELAEYTRQLEEAREAEEAAAP